MTLLVTAASDVFAQDIEDLPEEVREAVVEETAPVKPTVQPPQRRSEATNGTAWKEMASLYDGKCKLCERAITKGQMIYYSKEQGVRCAACKPGHAAT